MRKILSALIVGCIITSNVSAQRNTIRFIGIVYDNCMKSSEGVQSEASNGALHFAYERTFGDYLCLGVNFMLPFSALSKQDPYFLSVYTGDGSNYTIYDCTNYSEYHRWGISYTSKFFFSSFDEEADGFYIAPVIGYDSYALNMLGNGAQNYINGSFSGDRIYLSDVNKTYGVMRYGFRIGIQGGAGELFLGYTFNSVTGRDEVLPFSVQSPFNSSSISIGYNWGVSF